MILGAMPSWIVICTKAIQNQQKASICQSGKQFTHANQSDSWIANHENAPITYKKKEEKENTNAKIASNSSSNSPQIGSNLLKRVDCNSTFSAINEVL